MRLVIGIAASLVAICAAWCVAAVYFSAALAVQAADNLPVITTLKEYFSGPSQSEDSSRPVRILATATYVDPGWKLLFVQDDTGGSRIYSLPQSLDMVAGDQVLIEGIRTEQSATNLIRELRDVTTRRVGQGNWPKAVVVGAGALLRPEFNGRLVETRGTVRSVMEVGRLHLVATADGARFSIWVRHHQASDLSRLLDAQVTVRGVCDQNLDASDNPRTVNLLVTEFKSLDVDRPGPADPYAVEKTSIGKILAGQVELSGLQRVKIEGTVVQQDLDRSLLVQDETGRIAVRTPQRTPLARNDRIGAIGFPARERGEIVLEDGQFRLVQASPATNVTAAQADAALPTLTSIKQVLDLTRKQAGQGYPVQVTGVVTHADRHWIQLFIQDGDQAICLNMGDREITARSGRLLEVAGVTTPGGVLTMITPAKLEDKGEAVMPVAAVMTYHAGITGDYDSRRVKVKGAVRSVVTDENHLVLDLVATDGRFACTVPEEAGSTLRSTLENSLVEVEGVCILNIDALGSPIGITLAADRERDITIVEKAPADEFNIPTHSIVDVLRFIPPRVATRRLKIAGAATLWRPGRELYLQDQTGAIRTLTTQTNQVELGDEIELIGFRVQGECVPMLQNSEFRVARKGRAPSPKLLRPAEVLAVTNHGMLLQLTGRLVEDAPASAAPELLLESEGDLFVATVETLAPGRLSPAWQAGSRLRVTGVCHLRVDESQKPRAFRLLARSLADVEILETPPWLTSRRIRIVLIVLLIMVVLALSWIAALRRLVSKQTGVIRQRLESEAAIEKRLVHVWENSADGMRMSDADGTVVQVNRAYCQMVRKRREELIGHTFTTAYRTEERDSMLAHYRDKFARRAVATHQESEMVLWNGDRVWFELANAFFEQPGFPSLLLSQFRDITERKRAEAELRRSEERHRSMIQYSPMGMHLYELRDDDRLIFVGGNPAADRLLRVDNRQFVGLDLETAFPPLTKTEVPQRYRLAAREGTPWQTEQIEYHEGQIQGAFEVHAFQISPGRMVAVFLDITDRKRAEVEREKLHEQLLQAQKMESVGRLAGGVAHDFNNMLQVILGNTLLALEDVPPGAKLHEDLLEIQKSAQRSADLTRQLLAFARKQTINPEILDLNDKTASLIKMLQRLIGENIQLAWIPALNLWPVKMDPSQIDQILVNLSVNARDAIKDSGRITIETRNANFDDTYSRAHPECVPGDYVMLSVSDTGRGLDAAAREHLFEPFFTTKEMGKGTGLGLATVFGIVKQNLGLINVYSEPGRGAIFKIYLPRAAAAPAAPPTPERRSDLRGTETILLVEDEEQVLGLGRRILAQHGYTVLVSRSSEEALERVASHSGRVHLLITDVIMPGMNGKELKHRMDKLQPGIRCIFVSGYTANVIAHHGVLDNGVHFLQKPFTVRTLTEKVREVLEA